MVTLDDKTYKGYLTHILKLEQTNDILNRSLAEASELIMQKDQLIHDQNTVLQEQQKIVYSQKDEIAFLKTTLNDIAGKM